MRQLSIEISQTNKKETARRKRLLLSIHRKRIVLKMRIIKVETLKADLQSAKTEYMIKVGSLFLKDNHLDLEIIRCKNIINLMDKGFSHDEAADRVSQTYYAQQIEIENEQRRIEYEQILFEKLEDKSNPLNKDIKKLWKKLISKFHPDLVQDNKEKLKRDKIMKEINRAYHEGDYNQLSRIQNENNSYKENTIDNLEEILISVENEIIAQNETYNSLKLSEWYGWMKKINIAKKKNFNIFADTEKRLLDDIAVKFDLLKNLKQQILEKEKANSDPGLGFEPR